jgi:hypothetical protein
LQKETAEVKAEKQRIEEELFGILDWASFKSVKSVRNYKKSRVVSNHVGRTYLKKKLHCSIRIN